MEMENQTRMKEVPCIFCGSELTLLFYRKSWISYQCHACCFRGNILLENGTDDVLKRVPLMLEKTFGKRYHTLLRKGDINYHGPYCCPFCFEEVTVLPARKSSKRLKYWRWQCGNCFSKGNIPQAMLKNWKFISIQIRTTKVKKRAVGGIK